ncbi:MAG: hypothetical protein ACPGU9_01485 [Flavobacteriaceae bacterium]
MKINYLLPHRFKKLGWGLLVTGVLIGAVMRCFNFDSDCLGKMPFFGIVSSGYLTSEQHFFEIVENGFLDELVAILIIVGGILVGFCKTKIEDEFILQMRLSSLVWSVYVNYAVLFFAVLFVFDMSFFDVMILNMFTVLLFFIARFHLQLYKSNRL